MSSAFSSFFSPFNCCLSVFLELNQGEYCQNLHVMFCPNNFNNILLNLICVYLGFFTAVWNGGAAKISHNCMAVAQIQ